MLSVKKPQCPNLQEMRVMLKGLSLCVCVCVCIVYVILLCVCLCSCINYPSVSDWIGFCVCAGVRLGVHACSCLNYLSEQILCLQTSLCVCALVWVHECLHQELREYLCA